MQFIDPRNRTASLTNPSIESTPQPRELKLVPTGRARTLASVTAVLVLAHWTARWAVLRWAPEMADAHHVPFPWVALLALPVIVVALTVLCLNRVILIGVACILGGATANLSELAVHGAVTDFILPVVAE